MNFEEKIIERLKRLEREVERLRVKEKQVFVPLTTPLTSTSWDGDGYSTVGRTKIDLSSVFGVPDGIKAVLLSVKVRDSASQTSDTYIVLGPTNTAGNGVAVNPQYTNDRYNRVVIVVPCDSNGDIYYDITASGTGTFDVIMQVFGYWL